MTQLTGPAAHHGHQTAWQVFIAFLRLGFTAFGGPIAHLGYFRDEFVVRRRWLDEAAYADLVALCQFLPGPASSQVGIGIGLTRAGLPGALAAWVGFTLPSAVALTLFSYGVVAFDDAVPIGALQGLKIAAVAVVAQALWGMGRTLCPDPPRMTLAVLAAAVVLMLPSPWSQVGVIAAGALAGWLVLGAPISIDGDRLHVPVSRVAAIAALFLLILLLPGLPALASVWPNHGVALADAFFRTGSLVFGGGHVVLPLLQAEVVPPGWVTNEAFLAGYGAAQAVPGPLFAFAAYLGTVMNAEPNAWLGAVLCLVAIFVPSFLFVIGVLPFWTHLREVEVLRRALLGVNAAVVGVLLAALYDPVWASGVRAPADFALALGAFVLLVFWRRPHGWSSCWPPSRVGQLLRCQSHDGNGQAFLLGAHTLAYPSPCHPAPTCGQWMIEELREHGDRSSRVEPETPRQGMEQCLGRLGTICRWGQDEWRMLRLSAF